VLFNTRGGECLVELSPAAGGLGEEFEGFPLSAARRLQTPTQGLRDVRSTQMANRNTQIAGDKGAISGASALSCSKHARAFGCEAQKIGAA
jgi:hypothetical protein